MFRPMKTFLMTQLLLLPFLLVLGFLAIPGAVCGHGSPPLSRHYRLLQQEQENSTSDLPKVVVVADGGRTTGGPFAFSKDIYTDGGNLLAAADERSTVAQGIPLNLTFVLYALGPEGTAVAPLKGAEVYLWQADAIGDYSYVASMNTASQTWLRARATSNAQGKAIFSTILPGWYPGRAIHWHFRVRLEGENEYYVTSQLFVANEFLQSYNGYGVYADNSGRLTWNENDGVFRSLEDNIASELILSFNGSNHDGYSATFHLGIDVSDAGISIADGHVNPDLNNGTTINGGSATNQDEPIGTPGTDSSQRHALQGSCFVPTLLSSVVILSLFI